MFTSAFLADLDTVLARHNIARSMRGNTITLTDLGAAESEGKRMLRLYGAQHGLTEQDFGAIITHAGVRYKLVGLKPSRPKYPLDMEHQGDGRVFKFTTSFVPQIVAQRAAQVPVMQTPQQQIPPRTPAPTSSFQAPAGMPQF